jgi:hypothetical protein
VAGPWQGSLGSAFREIGSVLVRVHYALGWWVVTVDGELRAKKKTRKSAQQIAVRLASDERSDEVAVDGVDGGCG